MLVPRVAPVVFSARATTENEQMNVRIDHNTQLLELSLPEEFGERWIAYTEDNSELFDAAFGTVHGEIGGTRQETTILHTVFSVACGFYKDAELLKLCAKKDLEMIRLIFLTEEALKKEVLDVDYLSALTLVRSELDIATFGFVDLDLSVIYDDDWEIPQVKQYG